MAEMKTPGSISTDDRLNLFDPEFAAHPHQLYQRIRAQCPVAREAIRGGAVLSRYEDVLFALRHPEIFSSSMEAVAIGNDRPLIPLQIDPPNHTRYRKILDPRFSKKRVRALEPDIRAFVNQLIDRFIDRGECEFNRDFAIPLPCTVFLKLMGLPLEDLDALLALKDGIIRPRARGPEEAAELRKRTGKQIYAYFEQLIDARAQERRDDLMSYLLEIEVDDHRLSRSEILDICYLFLLGGLDTVTASLGCAVAHLAAHPDRRRELVANPTLFPGAVEELLRYETPVLMVARVIKQPVTIQGVDLHPGEPVSLLLGSADTDEAEFPEAERVDFGRTRNRHLAFGGGPHRCLGSHLARMELRVALEEFHRRIPDYAIRAGEEPRYGLGIREVQHLPLVFGRPGDSPAPGHLPE